MQMPSISRDDVVGVDIATGVGADRTVIASRVGKDIFVHFVGQMDTVQTAQKLMNYLRFTRNICIDCAGIGLGVTQSIQHMGGFVHQVNGNATSFNPCAINKRAELYIQLKAFLDAGNRIFVPFGQKSILEDELRSIKVEMPDGKNGRLKIGDKKDLPNSPDIVDALTYTFFLYPPTHNPVYYY